MEKDLVTSDRFRTFRVVVGGRVEIQRVQVVEVNQVLPVLPVVPVI